MKHLKLFNFVALMLLSDAFVSCGEGLVQEKPIKANNVTVSGAASAYIKVVDGDYTLKVVEGKIIIPVKLQLTKKYTGKETQLGNLSFIPLDKTGAAVPDIGLNMHPATMGDWGKIEDLLKSDIGKEVTISFEWNYFANKKIQARIMKETESFEITNADFTGSSTSDNSSKSSENVGVDAANNSDWDQLLVDYESYVDQYITLYKKSKAGDASALTEYPGMMEKAANMEKSLIKAKDSKSLSNEQMIKLVKIQNKMVTALSK